MANKFSVNTLILNKQNVTATGSVLYVNQTPVGSGLFLSLNDTGLFSTSESLFNTGQLLYPRDNPSGYVRSIETGNLVDNVKLENTSGVLVSLISASSAGVGSLNSLSGIIEIVGTGGVQISTNGQNIYISGGSSVETGTFATAIDLYNSGQFLYPNNNPSGFITGIIAGSGIVVTNNLNGSFTIDSTSTGSSSTNTGELTGIFYPLLTNPSGYVASTSGYIYSPNAPQIYDGQLLIGSSGDNAFIQSYLYGSSGIALITGSGTIGISINQSIFILPSQTGVFATTALVGLTGQSLYASIVSLSGMSVLDSETGVLATKTELYNSGQLLYPANNPSGFITGRWMKSANISNVTATDDLFLFYTERPLQFTKIVTMLTGTADSTVNWTLYYVPTINGASTDIMTGQASLATNIYQSLTTPSVPADNWINIKTTATGNSPLRFTLSMFYN